MKLGERDFILFVYQFYYIENIFVTKKKKEKRKRYTDMYLHLHVYFPVISPY